MVDEEQLKIAIPSGIVVSGPSNSGKTHLVIRLLDNAEHMFTPRPRAIVWAYGQYNSEMMPRIESKGWILHEGIPTDEWLKQIPSPFILVLDDLMGEDAKRLSDIFTKKAHHNNFCAIFLAQNLFHKSMREPRSNAQYLCLLRAPNDMLSIRNLANQLYPKQGHILLDAYAQCCAHSYGYLFITMHPSAPDIIRLRTNIFPGEQSLIFSP